MLDQDHFVISGEGGGGKKSGGRVTQNNLQSLAKARFIELLSEGEIVGLVNGARSIYFNQTPLQNEDGTFNFDNVIWQERKGLPDDEHLNGHSAVEQVTSVETEVKQSTGPVTRTIVDPNADAVRVIIRLNSLFKTDDKGNIQNHSVSYRIEMRPSGGVWGTVVNQTIANRKTSSPVQIAHRFELPSGHTSWEVRVSRTSSDDTIEKNQSGLAWESYVTLIEGRFTYPHSALVGIEVNAEDLGTSIPPRAFEIKGLKINVPVNYDPDSRAYAGIWNGAFKTAWTNNPAWIFYDLVVNDRYGLGEFVNPQEIDKWSLYRIAQYCDELVPSGFKNELGADIMEPRFTFNGVISSREEAYFCLQKITTAFRGMGYWAVGQYFASADMPEDPVMLVTPANVIDGKFTYSSTATKARHSVAIIKWNDPENFYRPATELVIDEAALQKNGWREKRLDLLGCTSRGLARRYGKWALDTENTETETIQYSASFDHAVLRPGHIIAVTDPRRATMRMGGRIVSHVGTTVTLDADVTLDGLSSYQLYLTMPDGSLELLAVSGKPGPAQLTVASSAQQAMAGSVFILVASSLQPKRYRVLTVKETAENVFSISALFHDPTKYARVEQNILFDDIPYSTERLPAPPTALSVLQNTYLQDGAVRTTATVSWTPPAGTVVRSYIVSLESETETVAPYTVTSQNSVDLTDLAPGSYTVRVSTTDRFGQTSAANAITLEVAGSADLDGFQVINLGNLDTPGSPTFRGESPSISWVNQFPVSPESTETVNTSPLYEHNIVKVYDVGSSTLLRTDTVVGNSYTYDIEFNRRDSLAEGFDGPRRALRFDVQVKDVNGLLSPVATITLSNPAPAAITPAIAVEMASAYISWPAPADDDFRGVRAWIGTTPGFDPLAAVPVFDGPGGSFTYKGAAGTTVYLKIGAYDAFSKTDMVIAGPFTINFETIAVYFDAISDNVQEIVDASLSAVSGEDIDILYQANKVFGDIASVQETLVQSRITEEELTRANSVEAIAARLQTMEATAGNLIASVQMQQVAIATMQDTATAMIAFRAKAGSAGAILELVSQSNPSGSMSVARISADDIILDGTVTANLIQAESITTDLLNVEWLTAGRIQAAYIDVNTLLTIEDNAGLRYNKISATDDADGFYMGRDGADFGFAASRTSNDKVQSLKIAASTGLQIKNARHFVSGASPGGTVTRNNSVAKAPLPAGTKAIKLTLTGGGSSGANVNATSSSAGAASVSYLPGQAGAATIVRIYDGDTLVSTFTANGAAAVDGGGKVQQYTGSSAATANIGQKSLLDNTATGPGAGGNGGVEPYSYRAGGDNGQMDGTAYAKGGLAGQVVVTPEIDLSLLADPQIEIIVGAGGVNPVYPNYVLGQPGVKGRVSYTLRIAEEVPADIIPIMPTIIGSFSKAASATGNLVFPDLGPGLWVLNGNGVALNIGTLEVADNVTLNLNVETSAVFIARKRPNITVAGSANARTISYLFYSMTQWG